MTIDDKNFFLQIIVAQSHEEFYIFQRGESGEKVGKFVVTQSVLKIEIFSALQMGFGTSCS
jgi:hypothetical protein